MEDGVIYPVKPLVQVLKGVYTVQEHLNRRSAFLGMALKGLADLVKVGRYRFIIIISLSHH